jgi:hypothetical protein
MSNEKRSEHNLKARQAGQENYIANVNFHNTTGAMVGAAFDVIDGQEHVELRIGKATFFLDGRDSNAKVLEMLQIGYAVVAAADELMRNGAA